MMFTIKPVEPFDKIKKLVLENENVCFQQKSWV